MSGEHSVESASDQSAHAARVFDRRPLESVADAEVRDASLARNLRRPHHPARAARAESARDENAVGAVEQLFAVGLFERFGFDPLDVDLQPVREPAVVERLVEALVRILVADVLADDVNRDAILRVLDALDQRFPRFHVLLGHREAELLQHDPVEPFDAEHERHFVDRRHVFRRDDRFGIDVAEQRDLLLEIGVEKAVRCGRAGCRAGCRSIAGRARCAASASSSARRQRR